MPPIRQEVRSSVGNIIKHNVVNLDVSNKFRNRNSIHQSLSFAFNTISLIRHNNVKAISSELAGLWLSCWNTEVEIEPKQIANTYNTLSKLRVKPTEYLKLLLIKLAKEAMNMGLILKILPISSMCCSLQYQMN